MIVSETMYFYSKPHIMISTPDTELCYEHIILTYTAICLGRKETRVKCASFFRLCYCLTTMVYLAVSLHHFDTIVKNDMSWESPEIKIVPFRWLWLHWISTNIYVVVVTVRKLTLGSGLLMWFLLHICYIAAACGFIFPCLTFRSVWGEATFFGKKSCWVT